MTVTIITLVALLFILIIIFGARFIYSFSSNHSHNMQGDIKTKALDVFLYLGISISLITSITNILQILFTAIDKKYVDILDSLSNYYYEDSYSDVRFAIASLVVMFPIYVALSWYTGRDIKKFLYKQDIPVRKILIYVTLFITLLTLIGTLVSVIYTFLGGGLSVNFGLKALSVFLVAVAVFGYYFYSLRRDYSKKTNVPLLIATLSSIFVISSVVWSVCIIGSPKEMRARKIDNARLSDLSRIQQEVTNRFQMTDKLPTDLSELSNALSGYQVPKDPITKKDYGYKMLEQGTFKMNFTTNKKELLTPAVFEICSYFDTVRNYDERGNDVYGKGGAGVSMMEDRFYSAGNFYYEGDRSPFWNHEKGETCFKRKITPDMYYGR